MTLFSVWDSCRLCVWGFGLLLTLFSLISQVQLASLAWLNALHCKNLTNVTCTVPFKGTGSAFIQQGFILVD